jgi:hypothetical protein
VEHLPEAISLSADSSHVDSASRPLPLCQDDPTHRFSIRRKVDHSQYDALVIGQALCACFDRINPVVIRLRELMRFIEDCEVAFHWCRLARNCAVGDDYGSARFIVAGDDAAWVGKERHVSMKSGPRDTALEDD